MSEHVADVSFNKEAELTNKRLFEIERDLHECKEALDFIKEHIVKADTTISLVAEQVMPTIDELMKSPMLKMLGVGKKK